MGPDWPRRYARGPRLRVFWRSTGNARSGHIGSIGRPGRRGFAYLDATEVPAVRGRRVTVKIAEVNSWPVHVVVAAGSVARELVRRSRRLQRRSKRQTGKPHGYLGD